MSDGNVPPADPFGQIAGDITQGVAAANAVGGLVNQLANPLLDYHQQHEAQQQLEQRLKRRLGEWAPKAKKNGRWLQPMLTVKKFEDYRDKKNGYLTPSGECTSTFGWARLLFALGIGPEDDIVDWNSPASDTNPAETGNIDLEIPAQILWHIINLYRLYTESDLRKNEYDLVQPHYLFPFGNLSVEVVDGKIMAKFESKMSTTGGTTYIPFTCDAYSPCGDKLRFGEKEVINNYYIALSTGISHLELKFTEPRYPTDRLRELTERTKQLVDRLKALRSSSIDSPYLITPEWLEQASRIYRRITTDSGKQITLPSEITEAMKAKPSTVQSIEDVFLTYSNTENWKDVASTILRRRLLLPNQTIRHIWTTIEPSASISEAFLEQIIDEELPSILKSFANAPQGTLKHTLGRIDDLACYLLTAPAAPEIRNTPGIVLEFTPRHKLWHSDCVVRG